MLCISVSPPGESLQAPWKLPGSHDARGVAVDAENGDRERPGNTTTETKASTQTKTDSQGMVACHWDGFSQCYIFQLEKRWGQVDNKVLGSTMCFVVGHGHVHMSVCHPTGGWRGWAKVTILPVISGKAAGHYLETGLTKAVQPSSIDAAR